MLSPDVATATQLTDAALYEEVVRRIRSVLDPDQIVLFGSRARGDHRPDSDVDVLVIQETDTPLARRTRGLYTALASLPLDVDVIVRTPQEVADWQAVSNAFVTTALREGRVLYARQS